MVQRVEMEAETAVEWAYARQLVHVHAERYGNLAALWHVVSGLDLPPMQRPSAGGGIDSAARLAEQARLGTRVDRSRAVATSRPVDPDAVLLAMTVESLAPEIRVLVRRHGIARTRPDWGADMPAEPETSPLRDIVGEPRLFYADVEAADGRRLLVERELRITRGGAEDIRRLRTGWLAWWDGLAEVAAVFGALEFANRIVAPPATERQPWTVAQPLLRAGKWKALDETARLEFIRAARTGRTALALASQFNIPEWQALHLRRSARRKGGT